MAPVLPGRCSHHDQYEGRVVVEARSFLSDVDAGCHAAAAADVGAEVPWREVQQPE